MYHYGIGHMVASALIHGVIYGVIWKVMRGMTTPEAIVLAVCVVAVVTAVSRLRMWR
jgi:hypothetical protein